MDGKRANHYDGDHDILHALLSPLGEPGRVHPQVPYLVQVRIEFEQGSIENGVHNAEKRENQQFRLQRDAKNVTQANHSTIRKWMVNEIKLRIWNLMIFTHRTLTRV